VAAAAKARDRLLAAALAIGAVILIAACGLQAARSWLAANNPQAAVSLGVADGDAFSAVAEAREAARPGYDEAAAAYARRALIAAPLDARAIRVLAQETEKDGGLTRARMMMVIADRWSRRDTAAQLWLLQQAMLEGDWPDASVHADALLRRHWQLEKVVFPAMAGALRDPAAVGPFVDRLSELPDWRRSFLSALAEHAPDPAVPARLFLALAATAAPPTDEDASNIVSRYVAQGDYAGARALWVRLLPRGAAPAAGQPVYNGDFRPLPGGAPFNWRLTQSEGVTAETIAAGDGALALHVLTPAAKDAVAADQLLTLAPGAWRLTGMARIEPGQSGEVFAWLVACLGQTSAPIAEARLAAGVAGWRPFSIDFTVPPDKACSAQWLRLEGLAHSGFEPAEGWFRGLRVQPIATPVRLTSPAPAPPATG
jgi:hypothetical protein